MNGTDNDVKHLNQKNDIFDRIKQANSWKNI
jgi:hypothetical protein